MLYNTIYCTYGKIFYKGSTVYLATKARRKTLPRQYHTHALTRSLENTAFNLLDQPTKYCLHIINYQYNNNLYRTESKIG